jgi:hypothetical protein
MAVLVCEIMRKTVKGVIRIGRKKSGDLFTKLIDICFPFIYTIHAKKFTTSLIEDISRSACIVPPLETLKILENFIIEKKKGAYMRFGDGDVFLAMGKNSMLHTSTKRLSEEMKESFSLKGPGIIKALMIHSEMYGHEEEMYIGNYLVTDNTANELLQYAYPYFVGYQIYSHIALHYAAVYYPAIANIFLRLLKKNTILFIGNENTPEEIVIKLFGEVKHIKTPAKNSYDKIDTIEKEAGDILENQEKFGVVITSMGESGRVLVKRLYKRNYNLFFFDFGSLLDGICGNKTRTWLRKANINYEVLLKQ